MPTALITGISGQDGSYLAELLLQEGYRVAGLQRRISAEALWRIEHLLDRVELFRGDLQDYASIADILQELRPSEIYNLASQSNVAESWRLPFLTADVNALGASRLFEAARRHCPESRIYQASSSEMFGQAEPEVQNELTPFRPRSPYGASKVHAHHLAVNYRESYGLFICCGILFNHESPRRTIDFVTRRISDGVARIALGRASTLRLGNLHAARDWGFAGDYVQAIHRILRHSSPREYVIATCQSHTVLEFAEAAFAEVGLDPAQYIEVDPSLFRPADIDRLRGDASLARRELCWEPSVTFHDLVALMVRSDLERLERAW